MAEDAAAWLQREEMVARTVTLKMRYHDFTTITRSLTIPATRARDEIVHAAEILLERTEAGQRPVRLLGVSVKNFGESETASVVTDLRLPFE